jgi:hypothetical protein
VVPVLAGEVAETCGLRSAFLQHQGQFVLREGAPVVAAVQLDVAACQVCQRVEEHAPVLDQPIGELHDRGQVVLNPACPGRPDRAPLQGMRLTVLYCYGTGVSDLAPLKDMPLRELACGDTRIADLSPLKGLPLILLYCYHTRVSDLSPFQGLALTDLAADLRTERDVAVVRSLGTLRHICGLPAAQFWKQLVVPPAW